MAAGLAGRAGEDVGMHQRGAVEAGGDVVLQAFGEMERGLFRNLILALQQFRCAAPADLDAAEQIGLRARHSEQALGLERRLRAEDLRVGMEAHLGAAPVGRAAELLQLALRLAAFERHAIELLAARDLDLQPVGEGVDHRHADAVQAAGGLVDLGVELAAGVQRAHDHFQRRLVLELGMRIDRHAAAVIGDGNEAVLVELDLDPVGVAGHRLVHRVVDDFREQMMQRLLVGAADIHAGTAADRLQPFQHLDVLGAVAGVAAARAARGFRRLLARGLFADGFAARRRLAAGAANRSGSDVFFLVAVLAIYIRSV